MTVTEPFPMHVRYELEEPGAKEPVTTKGTNLPAPAPDGSEEAAPTPDSAPS